MARTVSEGFDTFLQRLIPLESQRAAAASHRTSVENSIEKKLSVKRYRETGSFHHGTGIRHHCDVDLLVSIANTQPPSSDTALGWVRDALKASFPTTLVYVSRPAVVVDFAGGDERWEVIPGFLHVRGKYDPYIYDIPGAAAGWMTAAPEEHLNYVNEVNDTAGITGAAKKLSRLVKAWKYYNTVPVSSFYLEMRAAQYMATQKSFIAVHDICGLLEHLESISLAAMNDPKHAATRFYACSTSAKGAEAMSKLGTAATRARKALDAHLAGQPDTAYYYLDLLFGGNFPAR